MPAMHYYDPDHMKPANRTKFIKWYQDRVEENYVFDFQNELQTYCRSDVDILRRGMMTFRDDFIKIANIDPLQYITIASVCMAVYRSKYIHKTQLGLLKIFPGTRLVKRLFNGYVGYPEHKMNIFSTR